jgi:HlyD family secretion protein
MKRVKHKWLILVVLAAVIAIFAAFSFNRKTQPQYFTAHVERGDIHQVVEATGTINAVITVQVGSQVSGTIDKLFADFNSRVKTNQVIARIEPSLFDGAVLQAKADLENAKANLVAARATLDKAKATATQTKADYERTVGLAKDGVMSQQQLDLAKANYDTAAAQVSADIAAIAQAEAQVSLKKAALEVAQTNLDHTIIHSPIDGTVVARNVDVGQTVAASLQAPTLFTIAQDLTKMQVYAKTDESDVGDIRVGQPVTFKVDAFPKDTFHGRVSQVRMNATMVQNVVTYDTIVDFDNPELKLFPGMTAYVTIPVANATGVLKVPNGALRYKPDMKPEAIQALYKKYGIEAGAVPQARVAANAGEARPGTAQRPGEGQGPAAEVRASRADTAIVWKLRPDGSIEPVKLSLGITDHTYTEVTHAQGELKDGNEVVTGANTIGRGASRPTGPMGGGPPRR